jgi:hypothetical protein
MKLRVMHPAIGEFSFVLRSNGETTVGRKGGRVDVELNWDARVSRRHGQFWQVSGELWFQDLDSRNGSFHGQTRLDKRLRLLPGDSVLVGETAITVSEMEAATEATAAEKTLTGNAHPSTHGEVLVSNGFETIHTERFATDDLRLSVPLPDTVQRMTERHRRRYARLTCTTEVHFRLSKDTDWTVTKAFNVSEGGLFVESTSPPNTSARVMVRLNTSSGPLRLHGIVKHVVEDPQSSHPPGFGVEFVDMSTANRKSVRNLVDAISRGIAAIATGDSGPGTHGSSGDWTRLRRQFEVFAEANHFLDVCEASNAYLALKVSPEATSDVLLRAVQNLKDMLHGGIEHYPEAPRKRIEAAVSALDRVASVLSDSAQRLAYDFRQGLVRAKERIEAAKNGTGPSLNELRQAWNRVLPEQVDEAAILMREAFALVHRTDVAEEDRLRQAIGAGRDALVLNPFFEEFRVVVDSWQESLTALDESA